MTSQESESDRIESAMLVALHTGLLRRCPEHGETYDPGQHDYQGACMVANFLINCSNPMVAPFGGDRASLTNLLKTICREQAQTCSQWRQQEEPWITSSR